MIEKQCVYYHYSMILSNFHSRFFFKYYLNCKQVVNHLLLIYSNNNQPVKKINNYNKICFFFFFFFFFNFLFSVIH
jgi:hypothetical protein